MNERIEKLIEQCTVQNFSDCTGGFETFDKQKFAQLIVQECISINRQRMFSDYEGDSLRVAHNNALLCATSDMFEHFGVGE